MSVPNNVAKYVVSGHLGTGEIWNTAFWVDGYTTITFPTDATLLTAVSAGAWSGLKTKLITLLANGDGSDSVDAYYYSGGAAIAHAHAAYTSNGTGSVTHPKQIAAVTTLRTGNASRNGRGRMYWPATGLSVDSYGAFSATTLNSFVDSLATLLTSYKTGSLTPVVVSQTTTTTNVITSVDADAIPDTQRRRRNKLTSTRHSAAV